MKYLVHINGYNPDTRQVETLRFCTGLGFTTPPTANPPNTVYEARVIQAGSLKSEMFSQGGTSGAISMGFGEITLTNPDGALDYLRHWAFDGREIEVLFEEEGTAFEDFRLLYRATMQQAIPERNIFAITLRDKQFLLNRALQDLTFQGTNEAPDGLEGLPTDIMGKPKPIVIGKVFNVTPVCVNTYKLIYALNVRHAGQFDAETDVDALSDFDAASVNVNGLSSIEVFNIYDMGVPLTRGADYSSSEEMLADVGGPAAGTYRVCTSEGYFRLGSSPAGAVTADCADGFTAGITSTASSNIHLILNNLLSITDDDIELDDLVALDAFSNAICGAFYDSVTTGTQALSDMASGPGAWFGFDRFGKLRIKPIEIPLVDFIAELDESIIDRGNYEMLNASDTPNGVPVRKVNLNWKKNYTVQKASDLAGAVDDDRRSELSKEFRTAFKEDPTVIDKHLLAGELTFDTSLYDDPTNTEVARRLAIYSVSRDRLQITLEIRPGLEDLLNLGENVRVTLSRFGYDAGLIRKIISFDLNCSSDTLTLVLWG